MLLPWWTMSTWSALLIYPYTRPRESAVSRTNFSTLLIYSYLDFMKFPFLGFHVVVGTREDLSIDLSITNARLILTELRLFLLISTSQNSISNFFEKNLIFWFLCCSTCEDLSIVVSITNVGLILTKLRWFQLFVTSQNLNFELYWKKSNFLVSKVK